MKNMKWFAGLALAMGLGVTGASAQDWHARDYQASYGTRSRVERLRAEVQLDKVQIRENTRHGRFAAAQRYREELARDQRELNALLRSSRNDGFRR